MVGVGWREAATPIKPGYLGKSSAPSLREGAVVTKVFRASLLGSCPDHYRLVVGRDRNRVRDSLGDDFAHLPNTSQVRVDVAFALLVKDPLAVYEDFHDSLPSRGDGYGNIGAEVTEKLIRHPRGGAEVLSRYAVGDLYLDFSFHGSNSLSLKFGVIP